MTYSCTLEVTFPTATMAVQTQQVLSVDKERSDRVHKTFQVVDEATLQV